MLEKSKSYKQRLSKLALNFILQIWSRTIRKRRLNWRRAYRFYNYNVLLNYIDDNRLLEYVTVWLTCLQKALHAETVACQRSAETLAKKL